MQLCDFGCGKEATHQFKSSGKWCCATSPNKCEGKRKKDSEAKTGKNPFEGREHPRGKLGKPAWNKGKTYEELLGSERSSEVKASIASSLTREQRRANWKKVSEEKMVVVRDNMRKNRIGGYIPGSGRGKSGRYKGTWCDSTWELAYLMYCLDNGIDIQRNTVRYPYEFEGKQHKYLPDFIVDGALVEVKGYWTERDREKIRQCAVPITVIDRDTIAPYLEYATRVYGADFHTLYE